MEVIEKSILNEIQEKLATIIYVDETYYLRERVLDIPTLLSFIERLELLRSKVESDIQYQVSSMLAYLCRVYGLEEVDELAKAKEYFIDCLTYAQNKQDLGKEITTLIRLGEVYKYQNKHEEAVELFQKAKIKCMEQNLIQYLDFAYQHLGKCLMEMSDYVGAEKQFQLALHLRKQKQNQMLIDSTLKALKLNACLKELKYVP